MGEKEVEFYRRVKKYRVDPSGGSAGNPVPGKFSLYLSHMLIWPPFGSWYYGVRSRFRNANPNSRLLRGEDRQRCRISTVA